MALPWRQGRELGVRTPPYRGCLRRCGTDLCEAARRLGHKQAASGRGARRNNLTNASARP
eukprot:363250-Chlamydomonas_euryale.AAC.4